MKAEVLKFESPSGTRRIKITVHERRGFTPEEIKKHEVSMGLLETVLNSIEFRERLIKHPKLRSPFKRERLYVLIMSGGEKLSPEEDYEMDVNVNMYYASNKVVGYTKPSTPWTWVNRKFFSSYDYCEVACNAFHEWLHKMGFDHHSASDHASVPYALGYLVREMIKELMAGAKFTMVDGFGQEFGKDPDYIPNFPAPKKIKCARSWKTLYLKKVCWYVEA